jgi:hypothetical protein
MFFLSFPRRVAFWIAGPEEAKNLGGAKGLRLISDPFSDVECCKNLAALSRTKMSAHSCSRDRD